jgi:hypothetical protein
MSAQIPDILVERYRLKELSQAETDRLAGRIRQDATLRERIEALDRSDEEMRRTGALDLLAERVVRRTRTGAGAPRRLAASWAMPAVAAAAILALVLVVALAGAAARGRRRGDNGRSIGRSHQRAAALAGVYRRTVNGSETLADRTVARPGDVLRVGYHAAGRPYGVIFSMDGRGTVTMHLPAAGDRAVPARARGDDAPRRSLRARRCAALGTVLLRHRRQPVRGRAGRRRGAPRGRRPAAGRLAGTAARARTFDLHPRERGQTMNPIPACTLFLVAAVSALWPVAGMECPDRCSGTRSSSAPMPAAPIGRSCNTRCRTPSGSPAFSSTSAAWRRGTRRSSGSRRFAA